MTSGYDFAMGGNTYRQNGRRPIPVVDNTWLTQQDLSNNYLGAPEEYHYTNPATRMQPQTGPTAPTFAQAHAYRTHRGPLAGNAAASSVPDQYPPEFETWVYDTLHDPSYAHLPRMFSQPNIDRYIAGFPDDTQRLRAQRLYDWLAQDPMYPARARGAPMYGPNGGAFDPAYGDPMGGGHGDPYDGVFNYAEVNNLQHGDPRDFAVERQMLEGEYEDYAWFDRNPRAPMIQAREEALQQETGDLMLPGGFWGGGQFPRGRMG